MTMSDRIRHFKNAGKDTEELPRKRKEVLVDLRKSRKDEQLSKRRNIDTDEVDSGLASRSEDHGPGSLHVSVNEVALKKIVDDIFSGDHDRHLVGTQSARKILSQEGHTPIDVVIQAGVVPRCVEFLSETAHPDLQYESAWVLANIAFGTSDHTAFVVKAGAVKPLIEMLQSTNINVVKEAIWALGNIAADGPTQRDFVIREGIVAPLVKLAETNKNSSLLRKVAWTLCNLCCGKSPPPPQEATRQCLPALARLIRLNDLEVVTKACCALSNLSDGSNENIEDLIRSGSVSRLVRLLSSDKYSVITPCLRAVGNIVTGNDSQTQVVLKAGVLPCLAKLLSSPKANIMKDAAWTVSNIAAGTLEQINLIIHSGIVPYLMNILKHGDFLSQKEAIRAITNIASHGSDEHMVYLNQQGVISAFCDLLSILEDSETIVAILQGLENMLKAASKVNQVAFNQDEVASAIENCGGLDKIKHLQSYENTAVHNKA